MRAPFNTTVTLLDGPTTATPGFPRVVDAPCRIVPDPFFVDTTFPLASSGAYFTIDAAPPLGPDWTLTAPGVFRCDFGRADRAVFAAFPLLPMIVLRVESCTRQKPPPIYWRASFTEADGPPTACQANYHQKYRITNVSTLATEDVDRTSPTTWVGTTFFLEAEITPPGAMCVSEWHLTIAGFTYVALAINGTVTSGFIDPFTGILTYQLDPL